MDKTKDLIPVVIYQTNKKVWLIDRPRFNETRYYSNDNLIRLLRLDVSIWFLEHIQYATQEELVDILTDELNQNPSTLSFN